VKKVNMNNTSPVNSDAFLNARNALIIAAIAAGYLLLSYILVGFKSEQIFLVVFFGTFYFISRPTRKFIIGFSVFIVYWVVFDYMKAFPNYHYTAVHIKNLYLTEKKLFGFNFNGTVITPNEYWLTHGNTFLDILTGIFYLTWVPIPLLFAIYLFYTDRMQFFFFSLTFFWVNLIGFTIYYLYPAAPPWYVQQYGFTFYPFTPGNTAGLGKFDLFFQTGIFKSIYAKSSNVFAAMPSLHASYPLIVLYFGIKKKMGAINLLFAVIMIGIWFSAVYNSHHYVLDVLAGICCGTLGILSFHWLAKRSNPMNAFIQRWVNATA